MGTKICSTCRGEYLASNVYFGNHRGFKDGLSYVCKKCKSIKDKEYSQTNRGRESHRKAGLKYIQKHKEKLKQYRLKNKEKLKKMKEQYYQKNKKYIKIKTKEWKINNKEKVRFYAKKRRSAKRGSVGFHTIEEWNQKKIEYKNKCAYCGIEEKDLNKKFEDPRWHKFTEDHVIPITKGGTDYINNIVPACQACNSSKHNKLLQSGEIKYHLFWPYYNGPKIIEKLKEIFTADNSGRWIGQGPLVDKFEEEFGKKFGFKNCAMVSSGTAALHLAYVLSGVNDGDEVISSVLSCTATHHPLIMQGAKIIFADIDPNTLNINPDDIEKRITKKTKAIVVVNYGGLTCDLDRIMKIAKKHNLKVIEDAAQSVGAKNYAKADFTCISFQAIKNLSVGGDGGMLICKNKKDHKKALKLRWFNINRKQKMLKKWQAWDRRGITFDQDGVGYKYQGCESTATIGLIHLEDIDWIVKHRKKISECYKQGLKDIKDIEFLNDGDSSYWLFTIKVKDRNEFCKDLLRYGIETNIVHTRNDLFRVFGDRRLDLPGMDAVESKYVCLPLNHWIQECDVKYICSVIKEFYKNPFYNL